jgi:hypothetical protein
MDVKGRLAVVSTTSARRRLGPVKIAFTRVGLALIALVLFQWWGGFGYEKALWQPWMGKNSNGFVRAWGWSEVGALHFPFSLNSGLHLVARANADTRPD